MLSSESGRTAVARWALLFMTCPNTTDSDWDNATFGEHEKHPKDWTNVQLLGCNSLPGFCCLGSCVHYPRRLNMRLEPVVDANVGLNLVAARGGIAEVRSRSLSALSMNVGTHRV